MGTYAALVLMSIWVISLTTAATVSTTARVILPIAAVAAVASAWVRPERIGWLASVLSVWIPYLILMFVPQPGDLAWLPFGLLTTVVGVVSSLTPNTRLGAALIAVFAVLQWMLLFDPPGHIRLAASVIHGVPVLLTYQVAVAAGVLLSYRAARQYIDDVQARREYLEQLDEAESTLERQRAERLRATQRLHETVLNTLRAVGRHGDGAAQELADRCAEDLIVLEDWEYESRPHTIREIVETSISAVDHGDTQVEVRGDRDLTLSADVSDAIRSMLTELLVNVSRHARASRVTVGWSVLDDMRLVFTVEDDGVGIADKESGRLGIRRIVTDTAAALDGQVLLADRPGGGTVVTLRIRLRAPGIEKPVGRFTLDLPRTILKTMATATLVWSAVISPFVVIDLERPAIVGISSVVAAVLLLAFLSTWDVVPSWLLFVVLTMGGGNLVLAERFSDTCTSASGIQWLMNIFTVITMVGAVFGTLRMRVVAVLFAVFVPFYVLLAMEPGCAEYVWLPWLSMLTLIPTTVAFAMTSAAPEVRAVDAHRLDEVLSEQLRRERQADERRIRWAEALERSRQVMDDIVYSGAIDAAVRQRAEVADAQLRGQLLIEPSEDGALAAFALALIDTAAERGIAVKAEVLDVSRRSDAMSEAALSQVTEVLALARGEVQLKLFVIGDEESMTLVVPIVPGSMPAFRDGTVANGMVELQYDDLRLEFDPQSVDANGLLPLWISVSRPVTPPVG